MHLSLLSKDIIRDDQLQLGQNYMAIKQIYFPAFIFIFFTSLVHPSTYHKPCFWRGEARGMSPLMIWKHPSKWKPAVFFAPGMGRWSLHAQCRFRAVLQTWHSPSSRRWDHCRCWTFASARARGGGLTVSLC